MNRLSVPVIVLLLIGAFLFLATALSTPGESAAEFQERVSLQNVAETPPEPELDPLQADLERELQNLGDAFDGTVGIAVTQADDMATMAYNGEQPLPQQSVTKLWVAMTALDLVDEGAFSLSERVVLRRQDLTVFHQPVRDIVRARGAFATDYADLMRRAITRSDNTANDRLLRRIGGPQAVDAFLRRNRIDGIQFGTDERSKQSEIAGLEWNPAYSMGRMFYEARDRVPEERRRQAFEAYLADPMDGARTASIAEALARLARGDLLSEQSTALLRKTLEDTRSGPRRLKGGVQPGWTIGHKTGTGQFFDGTQSGYNDVGILTAPDGADYGVAVMIGSTRSSYAARMAMMQEVSRLVARYHEARIANQQVAEPAPTS